MNRRDRGGSPCSPSHGDDTESRAGSRGSEEAVRRAVLAIPLILTVVLIVAGVWKGLTAEEMVFPSTDYPFLVVIWTGVVATGGWCTKTLFDIGERLAIRDDVWTPNVWLLVCSSGLALFVLWIGSLEAGGGSIRTSHYGLGLLMSLLLSSVLAAPVFLVLEKRRRAGSKQAS